NWATCLTRMTLCPGAIPWRSLRPGSTARFCAPLTISATSASVSVFRPARRSTAGGGLSAPPTRAARRQSVSVMGVLVRYGLVGQNITKGRARHELRDRRSKKKGTPRKEKEGNTIEAGLIRGIEQVSKKKGVARSVITEALERAMLSAARRTFSQKRIEAKFN